MSTINRAASEVSAGDTIIVIGGDFNQFRIDTSLGDHRDIKEARVGPTRGRREIDRLFTNFGRRVKAATAVEPLESTSGTLSDHKVAYVGISLPAKEKSTWLSYKTRKYSKKLAEDFGQWLAAEDWSKLYESDDVNVKEEIYSGRMRQAMDRFFPLTAVRRKSDEPPWVNETVRRQRRKNRNLFRK